MKTKKDLEQLVRPLLRPATTIVVLPGARPPQNAQLESHFSGEPYFEEGEEWPTAENGNYLDFVCQIFNTGELELPESIQLIQFFYDWESDAWDTEDDGWKLKIYETLHPDKLVSLERPEELRRPRFCGVRFEKTLSLPDWEGLELHSPEAFDLACRLDPETPWECYQSIVDQLTGGQNQQSRLGGYPSWIQAESTPEDEEGEPMPLLFQLDSEENARLNWGDTGLIYVFYDSKTKRIEFTLQCT